MAWTISNWSPSSGTGFVRSPHFGPLRFGPPENVDEVADYCVGEPVLVEIEGDPPDFAITRVRPTHQRQPAGTEWHQFAELQGRFLDLILEEDSEDTSQFWLGNCCEYCTPDPARVRFEQIVATSALNDDVEIDSEALFRFASSQELRNSGSLCQRMRRRIA